MKRYAIHTVRILLGLLFFVQGLNGFLGFMPAPPMPPAAQEFMGALAATGYFFPLLKITELTAGTLLLINRWVPLGALLLAPIAVNIFAFHVFLAPAGLPIAIFVVAAEIAMGYFYFDAYREIFAGPKEMERHLEQVGHEPYQGRHAA